MFWSNGLTYNSGADVGIVNGFWGGDEAQAVSATISVPSGATAAVLELRYWALDSWDGGETAYIQIDGTTVWELDRDGYNDCAGWEDYTGDADIPDPAWATNVTVTWSNSIGW